MKIISHRGNIRGSIPDKENRPSYIDCAIGNGYDVEIDVRSINGKLWLGHDTPDYMVTIDWILKRSDNLWIHCKNLDCAKFLFNYRNMVKYFCHTGDNYVLTSTGHLWVHDLSTTIDDLCIIPLINKNEIFNYRGEYVYGICTDYVDSCKNIFDGGRIL